MRKPAPDSISIRLPDGRSLDATIEPPGPTATAPLTLIEVLQPRFFNQCPICGDPAATSAEHVPPHRLGGTVMTRTCTRCNNGFGSRVEADLVDWFENALTLPSFRSDAVRGKRRTGRVLVRWTPSGEFVLAPEGSTDAVIGEILAAGEVDLEFSAPDHSKWSLALLKSAYLAACLKFGVLEGEWADRVRADLLAARDARSRSDVPASAIAQGLTVLRHFGPEPITPEPVIMAVVQEPAGPLFGVLLAGRLFVSWSATIRQQGVEPRPHGRAIQSLHVDSPLNGVVTAVAPEPRH